MTKSEVLDGHLMNHSMTAATGRHMEIHQLRCGQKLGRTLLARPDTALSLWHDLTGGSEIMAPHSKGA